jgi:hypothetical protein
MGINLGEIYTPFMLLVKAMAYVLAKLNSTYEPRHNKTNIMGLRPLCLQTSLRIHAV